MSPERAGAEPDHTARLLLAAREAMQDFFRWGARARDMRIARNREGRCRVGSLKFVHRAALRPLLARLLVHQDPSTASHGRTPPRRRSGRCRMRLAGTRSDATCAP